MRKSILHPRASDLHRWPIFLLYLLAFGAAATFHAAAAIVISIQRRPEILDALDARGKDLKNFSARSSLTDTDNSTGDSTINTGTVIFQRKGNDDARIRVAFTKQQLGDKILPTVDHQYTSRQRHPRRP
jgi:hypothetical protein